jgi:hypothetical protein
MWTNYGGDKMYLKKSKNFQLMLLVLMGLINIFCSKNEDPRFKKKYIVIPKAHFIPGSDLEKVYPSCPSTDYPLKCEDKSSCCPEGYPFACPSTSKCYTSQPTGECPGEVYQCSPEPLIITDITPGNVEISYGQSLQVNVFFKKYYPDEISKFIMQFQGVDGYFEQSVSSEESSSGKISTEIIISENKPSLSTCLLECSRAGTCGPCFVETIFPSWTVYYFIQMSGVNYGTMVDFTQITLKFSGEEPEQPSYCSDGSECCTTKPDCGGGIGCTIDAITTPEDCDCPPNTTYSTTDIHYHVKICDCNEC